ncbi:MAG: polygalacturonase, partial [Bacilli bacterium]|nr:polygalacturonase [Bacilli bacterium]
TRNARITDCYFPSGGGLAIGSEMSGGIEGVFVQDVQFGNTDRGIQIKTRHGRGGFVKNVRMTEITMDNAGDFGIMLNMRYYDDNLQKPVGNHETTPMFDNLHFENIQINQSRAAILMPGLPESYIKTIHFKNIQIKADTGLNAVYCNNVQIDGVVIHVQSGSISHFKDCTGIQGEIAGTTLLTSSNLIADLKVNDPENEQNWVVLTNLQPGNYRIG